MAGCWATPSREPVGVSHSGPAAPAPRPGASAMAAVVSHLPPDFRTTWTRRNRVRFVSLGHAGRFEADLFAGEPAGTRFIEELFERGTGKPGPVYMMERVASTLDAAAAGEWRYVVTDPRGNLVKEGDLQACAGCHDEAPHDRVFSADE